MDGTGEVMVELYGIPRLRAGRSRLAVPARTLREALGAVVQTCPGLAGLVQANGRLSPHYLVSLDGQCFTANLDQPVRPGERLLLLSADAGG